MCRRTLKSWRCVGLCILALTAAAGCQDDTTEPGAGPPTNIAVSAGNEQTASAGNLLPAPIAVLVTDDQGHGVANVPVLFAVLTGSGEITPASSQTNGAGVALSTWRVGTVAPGEERAVAQLVDTLTGALIDTALFTARTMPGPANSMAVAGGNYQVGAPGETLVIPLQVAVRDVYGNPVAGSTVAWSVVSGGGTLASPTSVTDRAGISTNGLTLGQSEGPVTVRATLGTLTPVTFTAVGVANPKLTTLPGSGFGIALTSGGQLVVSLIYDGAVQRIPLDAPQDAQTITVGGTPAVVTTNAAGDSAYVANMDGTLDVVNLATNTKAGSISLSGVPPGVPHAVAMAPRGDRVYVTNTQYSVFAVDLATRSPVDTTVVTGEGPWGIAFKTNSADTLWYVTSRNGGSIAEVNLRTGNVLRTITVGGRPHGIAIAPNGSTLYVADDTEGQVKFVTIASGTVAGQTALAGAFGIAISPDGTTLYVTTNDGKIAVIDVATRAITKLHDAGGQPRQIVVLPGGNTALAANLGGWIDIVRR